MFDFLSHHVPLSTQKLILQQIQKKSWEYFGAAINDQKYIFDYGGSKQKICNIIRKS
jgi:hypothetical protein